MSTHTQPSEAHRKLAAEILFTYSVSGAARPSAIVAAAQLLRDSEARAVEAWKNSADFKDATISSLLAERDQFKQALTLERERVRVLREALEFLLIGYEGHYPEGCDTNCANQARAALAATEGKQ